MLEWLDKTSLYVAMALFGYLAYSMLEQRPGLVNERKEMPMIAKAMLHPKFVEPSAGASPVDRDPFLIQWDLYSADVRGPGPSGRPADKAGDPAGAEPGARLMGVLASPDGQNVAVIDGKAYEVGSLMGNSGSGTGWKIAEIQRDRVVLERGSATRVLKIVTDLAPHEANAPGQARGREKR